MKYKIWVQDELDQLIPPISGQSCNKLNDPVEITIKIDIEKKKYQAALEKILKLLQKI